MLVESQWSGGPPKVPGHLIVVAPHPDDEVFGAGEIMRWAVVHGARLTIVAVTDGEASHGPSAQISSEQLRRVRRAERYAALSVLGLAAHVEIMELHYPDAGVHRHVHDVHRCLRAIVGDEATICVPAAEDRHPDHRAVFEAGMLAADSCDVPLWPVPIWSRLDESHAPARAVLSLDPSAERRKRSAAKCFRSQLVPLGPRAEDGPVLTAAELHGFCTGAEVIC